MPSPNLTELIATTLRLRTQDIGDAVTRNDVLLMKLSERGKKTFTGGRTITCPIEYANNTTYLRYSGYDLLDNTPSDIMTAAEYPIRQAAVAISMSGLEMLQNAGKERAIPLLASRIKNAATTAKNGMAYDVAGDGTLPGQILGLQALISTTPTVGTIGGIDRSLWTFWQNQKYSALTDGGAALSVANIQRYMTTLFLRMVQGTMAPDMGVADNTTFMLYQESLTAIQRITSTTKGLNGFANLAFQSAGKEVPIYLGGGFQGSAGDGNRFGPGRTGAVGGVPASTLYFINSENMDFMVHAERDWAPLDPDRVSINQDAVVKFIGFAGNLCVNSMINHGVLTA